MVECGHDGVVAVYGVAVVWVVAVLGEEFGWGLPEGFFAGPFVFGIGDVCGVEGYVGEKGLVGFGASSDEVACGVGDDVSAVALGVCGFVSAVEVVAVVVAVCVVVAVA